MIRRFKKYYNINNEDVTPPPPPEGECYSFTLQALLDASITFTFTKCTGGTTSVTVPGNSSTTICAQSVNNPAQASNKWAIFIGDLC